MAPLVLILLLSLAFFSFCLFLDKSAADRSLSARVFRSVQLLLFSPYVLPTRTLAFLRFRRRAPENAIHCPVSEPYVPAELLLLVHVTGRPLVRYTGRLEVLDHACLEYCGVTANTLRRSVWLYAEGKNNTSYSKTFSQGPLSETLLDLCHLYRPVDELPVWNLPDTLIANFPIQNYVDMDALAVKPHTLSWLWYHIFFTIMEG